MNIKRWNVSKLNRELALSLAKELEIPSFLAMMLSLRGVNSAEEAELYLGAVPLLSDPFELPDMDKAVARIQTALDDFERIAIYGDYDADGITATAIVYLYLESCGADVVYYIPKREGEGYGLNKVAIESLAEMGVKLIVTVDNGIASIDEVDYAKTLGIDVVITDHHRPQNELPKACAVVDAYRKDSTASYKDFSGAGVAYQLVAALEGENGAEFAAENYADIAAIGTIGDVVPLTGENRKLVRMGVRSLTDTDKPGVYSLLEKASVAGKPLTATTVAFSLVPRINAAGRMGSPEEALRLLLCDDEEEAGYYADEICQSNELRKNTESDIVEAAEKLLRENPHWYYDRVIVLGGEYWHPGVLGIAAARLVERFGKPCIILSYNGNEAKGSGRSVKGFSLFEALEACSDVLQKYGGHTMAAGLALETDKIDLFRKMINEYAAKVGVQPQEIIIDCKLKPSALTPEIPGMLKNLEPYGMDNPQPLFGLYGMKLKEVSPIGGGKHLRITLEKDGVILRCVRFGMTEEQFPFTIGETTDAVVQLDSQIYRGTEQLTIMIRDMRPSNFDQEEMIGQQRIYEAFKRGETLSQEEKKKILPSREELAILYRFLREKNGYSGSGLALLQKSKLSDLGKLLIGLDVFAESGLIVTDTDTIFYKITLCETNGKADLTATSTMQRLVR